MQKWLIYALGLTLCLAGMASAATIRVSAAISLREALTAIAQAYQEQGGDTVTFAFGSSGQLATQIENGAAVDIFISAADKQVDTLAKEKLIDAASRFVVARNRLVLIVPADATNSPISFETLSDADVKKIAIGEPKTVPAGDYAMQTLAALKLADKLAGRIVYGANVRQVLTYVEMNEVSAGIVYATDARQAGAKVRVVATAQPETHQPIVYPAVIIAGSQHADRAAMFLAYLRTDKSRDILAAKGFVTGAPAAATTPAEALGK